MLDKAKKISQLHPIFWSLNFKKDNWLNELMEALANQGIATLMVEGGSKTLQLFLDSGLG
ncbi:MAG: hypothetical protein R2769_05220 [Saprospiraceae bacterium]